jgi:site-specific recombinase XerD
MLTFYKWRSKYGGMDVSMMKRMKGEITDFRVHVLRYPFASHQAVKGVQARGLQELLGHKDGRMTTRYSYLSDSCLREGVNAVVLVI